MIREVTNAPLQFQQTVANAISEPLSVHGFQWQPPLPCNETNLVIFARERAEESEQIWFNRCSYDEDFMRASFYTGLEFDAEGEYIPLEKRKPIDDEVDAPEDDLQGRFWFSRHKMSINIVSYGSNSNLLTIGKMGGSVTGEEWWHFKDEADLRQKLHDEVLPLILTVGLQKLDDRLEDIQAEHATQTAV